MRGVLFILFLSGSLSSISCNGEADRQQQSKSQKDDSERKKGKKSDDINEADDPQSLLADGKWFSCHQDKVDRNLWTANTLEFDLKKEQLSLSVIYYKDDDCKKNEVDKDKVVYEIQDLTDDSFEFCSSKKDCKDAEYKFSKDNKKLTIKVKSSELVYIKK